jgi:hypothetical protein
MPSMQGLGVSACFLLECSYFIYMHAVSCNREIGSAV